MQERKFIIELTSQKELPYVDNKKLAQSYSKKASKIKKINLNQQSESDKTKSEYLKLCKQIRFLYGVRTGKNTQQVYPIQDKRIATQNQLLGHHKLIIREDRNSKLRAGLQPQKNSQLSNKFSSHFIPVIQNSNLSINLQGNEAPTYPNHPALKIGKRKKILNNYLVKRLETQYLNIEKIKLQNKSKVQKRQCVDKNISDSSTNFTKQPSRTEQSQPTSYKHNKLIYSKLSKEEAQSLPIITSITKGMQKQENQQSQQCMTTKQPEKTEVDKKNKNAIKPRSVKEIPIIQKPGKINNRIKQFNPLFETYYYRDLLWKTNYSNGLIIQTPLQYEHRLRVFIGRGNNSGLLQGLIKRRIWFAITQKIEDANFVWTQIKYLPYFNHQKTQIISQQKFQSSNNDKLRNQGILTQKQFEAYNIYFSRNVKIQERAEERLQQRNNYFIAHYKKQDSEQLQQQGKQQQNSSSRSLITTVLKSVSEIKQQKMHNHFINNYVIGNKKALFKTMAMYYKKREDYVFNYLPYTFHIEKGVEDENYFKFLRFYYQRNKESKAKGGQEQTPWIVKPGEFSNRGNGIKVCKTLDQIKAILKNKQKYADGTLKTYIVQAYIQRPLLYHKRKFDLRHYMMMTCVNGVLKGYWYREGYVRTSSSQYTLNTNDGRIHLTNDAVQKTLPDYGKYEKGNKISYDELHNYLLKCYGFKNYNFKDIIIPKMKKMTTDIINACSGSIDPQLRSNNFQIFGLDFMIDADFNVWLIEVNTNPCLQLSCPLLGSIIPKMVQNALELTLDSAYPPPVRYNPKGVHYLKKLQQQNKFDLIYDSRIDGFHKQSELDARLLNQQEQTYQDDGQQWNEDD